MNLQDEVLLPRDQRYDERDDEDDEEDENDDFLSSLH